MASTEKPVATVEPDPVLAAAQAQITGLQSAAMTAATADDVLVQALTPWLGATHIGINARGAHDVLTWMSARGYTVPAPVDVVHHGVNVVGDSVPEAPAETA